MNINGHEITAKQFAYDGCHKIYLLENKSEVNEAREYGYNIFPISELKNAYDGSCGLRFISGWQPDFKQYVPQFDDAVFGEEKQ